MYRVSTGIAPQFYSAMHNLQFLVPFLSANRPLSRPGAWAHPDMLQVANRNPIGNGTMSTVEWQTHFAAWCVTSSPLILGFDLTDEQAYSAAYPIISNPRAIDINQLWAGEPGRLVKSSKTMFWATAAKHAIDQCENGLEAMCLRTRFPIWQLWAKTLPEPYPGWQAVLLINLSPDKQDLSFHLSDLGVSALQAEATDVWSGNKFSINSSFGRSVEAHGHMFLLINPVRRLLNSLQLESLEGVSRSYHWMHVSLGGSCVLIAIVSAGVLLRLQTVGHTSGSISIRQGGHGLRMESAEPLAPTMAGRFQLTQDLQP